MRQQYKLSDFPEEDRAPVANKLWWFSFPRPISVSLGLILSTVSYTNTLHRLPWKRPAAGAALAMVTAVFLPSQGQLAVDEHVLIHGEPKDHVDWRMTSPGWVFSAIKATSQTPILPKDE